MHNFLNDDANALLKDMAEEHTNEWYREMKSRFSELAILEVLNAIHKYTGKEGGVKNAFIKRKEMILHEILGNVNY